MNAIFKPQAVHLPEQFNVDVECINFDRNDCAGTVALVSGDDYITVKFTAEKETCHTGYTGPIDYYGGCQDVYAEFWEISTTATVVDSEGFDIQPGTVVALWEQDRAALEDALNDQYPAETEYYGNEDY